MASEIKELVGSRRETVLIVDDEESVREILVCMLGELGFKVLVAYSGEEARRIFEKSDKIDWLLADVILPGGVSGIQLAADIASCSAGTKTVLMSGYSLETLKVLGYPIRSGSPFLLKPFSKAALERVLGH